MSVQENGPNLYRPDTGKREDPRLEASTLITQFLEDARAAVLEEIDQGLANGSIEPDYISSHTHDVELRKRSVALTPEQKNKIDDILANMSPEDREAFIADRINNFNDTRLYHKRGQPNY